MSRSRVFRATVVPGADDQRHAYDRLRTLGWTTSRDAGSEHEFWTRSGQAAPRFRRVSHRPFLNAARESDSGMPGRSRVLDRRVNLTDAVSQIGMVQEGVDELS